MSSFGRLDWNYVIMLSSIVIYRNLKFIHDDI